MNFDGTERQYTGVAHGTMSTGSVQAWTLSGNDKHPFHIHINSFQLGTDVVDTTGYYQTGDWHDVFYRPTGVTASKIYFQGTSCVSQIRHTASFANTRLTLFFVNQRTSAA